MAGAGLKVTVSSRCSEIARRSRVTEPRAGLAGRAGAGRYSLRSLDRGVPGPVHPMEKTPVGSSFADYSTARRGPGHPAPGHGHQHLRHEHRPGGHQGNQPRRTPVLPLASLGRRGGAGPRGDVEDHRQTRDAAVALLPALGDLAGPAGRLLPAGLRRRDQAHLGHGRRTADLGDPHDGERDSRPDTGRTSRRPLPAVGHGGDRRRRTGGLRSIHRPRRRPAGWPWQERP